MPSAVVLFSGGLDSMLALKILQLQGFQIEALNIRTLYSCCQAGAAQVADRMGARLTVFPVGDDYLEVIRNPRYGYGKGMNPCVDCRIYMCRVAKQFMEEVGASVVATGEVLGQRPMSQKRPHLEMIARRSGLEGRLLRPLSAKLLSETTPEREGEIDRSALYDFNGRGRRELIKLAETLDLPQLPTPSTGCALTEPAFSSRVRDLLQYQPDAVRWDFELLNYGRHFRIDPTTKIVVGRHATDNAALRAMAQQHNASQALLVTPEGFAGPDAMVVGSSTPTAIALAGALMARFAACAVDSSMQVRVGAPGDACLHAVTEEEAARTATPL